MNKNSNYQPIHPEGITDLFEKSISRKFSLESLMKNFKLNGYQK